MNELVHGRSGCGKWRGNWRRSRPPLALALWLCLGFAGLPAARATVISGSWVPVFRGIDHSVHTNLPSAGGMPHLQVMHALRVDLSDPDIRLFSTPPISNAVSSVREVGALTVSAFLRTNRLQAAINANLFDARDYSLAAGTPLDVFGLAICEGKLVSPQDTAINSAALLVDAQNQARIVSSNWPPVSVEGVYTAISGTYPILLGGTNVARPYVIDPASIHDAQPRTACGLSEDRRYLFLITIDGRQAGYSEGAYDWETAEWLLLLGAADGINLDGGGSTTMVIENTTGAPLRLNRPSALLANRGLERTVGSHFGVFAQPLSGFVNEVVVTPDDVTAKITWTSLQPATAQVHYGTTTNLTESSIAELSPVTAHTANLSGLTPVTGYYFRISSQTETQTYLSPIYYFSTTNYAVTNLIFELSQPWRFSAAPPVDMTWIEPAFNDETWEGSGPGLLWVDTRPTGPNPDVEPKVTQMPYDPATIFPYRSYYFRTHFNLAQAGSATALRFSGYIDDGAIFYLNGQELLRLRMPTGSITSQTLAIGYPCEGDANCLDEFSVGRAQIPYLAEGDNVLAVEVHNYNSRSADITFGMTLSRIDPLARNPKLELRAVPGGIALEWKVSGFVLEAALDVGGPWTEVADAQVSPVTITASEPARYFRLRKF